MISAEKASISSVVNSASMVAGLSPGEIFTVFGTGLAVSGSTPTVSLGARQLLFWRRSRFRSTP